MAEDFSIEVEVQGAVRIVRIDRPPANAIDLGLAEALARRLRDLLTQDGAVLLTGNSRFFSAGVDLRVIPNYAAAEQRRMVMAINRLIEVVYAAPVPVVAAMTGHAIAGGMVLALCADYRIGAIDGAKYGITEVKAAIPFPAAGIEVMRAEMTPQARRVYALASENHGGSEALAAGLLDEAVPADHVFPRALETASRMAALPAGAYKRVKQQLRRATMERICSIVENDDDPALDDWLSTETAEASRAILEESKTSRRGG